MLRESDWSVQVEVHPLNRGYGGNQKTCYRLALAAGADIVVMIHPDYQYTPSLIPALASMVSDVARLRSVFVWLAGEWPRL